MYSLNSQFLIKMVRVRDLPAVVVVVVVDAGVESPAVVVVVVVDAGVESPAVVVDAGVNGHRAANDRRRSGGRAIRVSPSRLCSLKCSLNNSLERNVLSQTGHDSCDGGGRLLLLGEGVGV